MGVAVIGLGVMGGEICRHVVEAGFATRVADACREAVERAAAVGAIPSVSPSEAGDGADVALLSLPGPEQVIEVVLGPDGLLGASTPPRWIVDLSTNSLGMVRRLSAECAAVGVSFLDGPVSGGRPKAMSGELSLMLGADTEVPESVLDVLRTFTAQIFPTGPVGTGTVTKLANNQLFLTACAALQESYLMAAAAGVDLDVLHTVLRSSSAAPVAVLAPFLMRRNFDEVGFRLDIAAKDLDLSTRLAEELGVPTPTSGGAADLYRRAVDAGFGGLDFHGLLRVLEVEAGCEAPQLTRRGA
jgi:2-hydroxy-3-oxopropionate reductase